MASKTIESNQFPLNLPGQTTPLYFKTKTTFTPDVNGNPIQGTSKTELLYTPNGSQFFTSATSTEGGKAGSWELKKYTPAEILNTGIAQFAQPDGTILGPTTVNSLQTPNGVLNQITQNSIIQAADKENIKGGYQKPLVDKLKNTASPSEGGGDEGSFGVTAGITTDLTIKSKNQRTNYGPPEHLRYPQDLKNQDVITFSMRKYTAPSGLQITPDGDSFTGLVSKRKQDSRILGTVVLPIQPTIIDDNSVRWNDESLNTLELAALNLSSGGINFGTTGISNVLDNMQSIIQGSEGQNIANAIKTAASGAAIGKNVLARVSGAIVNPNIELLFNGPSLRVFNYRFQLSPRNQDETRNIMKIIRFFKQGMAVQRSPENLFLTTPNIFDVKYLFKEGDDHPYINRIKTCALTRCSVDYTPTGSYMTFSDGGMVSYSLNLTFEELEPIYADDYTEKIDGGKPNAEITSIGF